MWNLHPGVCFWPLNVGMSPEKQFLTNGMGEQRERQPPGVNLTLRQSSCWLAVWWKESGRQRAIQQVLGFCLLSPGSSQLTYLSLRQQPRRMVTGTRFGARLSRFKSTCFCSLDLWAQSSISSLVKLWLHLIFWVAMGVEWIHIYKYPRTVPGTL